MSTLSTVMIKRKFATFVATAAFLTLAAAATAQQIPMQQTGSRTTLSAAEKQFLTTTAEDSQYEVASAQLAVQKAQRPEVEQYALGIMDDHAQFNKALMQLGRQKGLTLPVSLSSKDKAKLDRLTRLQDTAFDRQYVQEVAQANATSVTDLNRAARISKDQDVQAFISRSLPVDQKHLQLAKALQNGSTSSTGTSTPQ